VISFQLQLESTDTPLQGMAVLAYFSILGIPSVLSSDRCLELFWFPTVNPISPPLQSYCHLYLFHFIPPSLSCPVFLFILFGKEPGRGPGADYSDYRLGRFAASGCDGRLGIPARTFT